MNNKCMVCKSNPCKCFVKNTGIGNIKIVKTNSDKNIRVVIKTNYDIAHKNNSREKVGKHAQNAFSYQSRDLEDGKNKTGERESETGAYKENGQKMTNEEAKEYRKSLKDVGGFRRIILSPDPKYGLTKEDLKDITEKVLEDYRKLNTNKEYKATFAIHTDTEVKHTHILLTSKKGSNIKWKKEDLKTFKEIARSRVEEKIREKEKEQNIFRIFKREEKRERENTQSRGL